MSASLLTVLAYPSGPISDRPPIYDAVMYAGMGITVVVWTTRFVIRWRRQRQARRAQSMQDGT